MPLAWWRPYRLGCSGLRLSDLVMCPSGSCPIDHGGLKMMNDFPHTDVIGMKPDLREVEMVFNLFVPPVGGSHAIRKSRNVRDGYARGWGLQCGQFRESVLEDALYQEASRLAMGRTVVSEDNRMNMFLILKYFLPYIPFGHIVEFGSYKGGNALFMAYVVDRLYPGRKVFALDTFSGMPETESAIDAHRAGDFQDVDLLELREFAEQQGVRNVEFIKGLFQETGPSALAKLERIALAHIDCDIYSAVAFSYDLVKHCMVSGGYVVFDDATTSSCLGATEAVEELVIRRDGLHSEQIFPQFVFRAPGYFSSFK